MMEKMRAVRPSAVAAVAAVAAGGRAIGGGEGGGLRRDRVASMRRDRDKIPTAPLGATRSAQRDGSRFYCRFRFAAPASETKLAAMTFNYSGSSMILNDVQIV